MAKLEERVNTILAKTTSLKAKANATDTLVETLEKDKSTLPASSKAALTAYTKKKL